MKTKYHGFPLQIYDLYTAMFRRPGIELKLDNLTILWLYDCFGHFEYLQIYVRYNKTYTMFKHSIPSLYVILK